MPKIPTYLAGESIRTGSTGPEADASSFAVPIGAVGQGLQNLGGDLSDVAYRTKLLQEKQKRDDERQWIRTAATQLEKVFTEFHVSEENQSKETFGADFLKFATEQASEYQKNAPSSRAQQAFKTTAEGLTTTFWRNAELRGHRNKEVNRKIAFEQQTQNALISYRNNKKAGIPEADELLSRNLIETLDEIDSAFGRFAPAQAAESKEKLVRDAVLGVAAHDPEFAREILDSQVFLSGPTRESLLNHIEAAEKTGSALAQEETRQYLGKLLDTGERGQLVPAPDEASVFKAFGPDRGKAILLDFKEKAQKLNQANALVASLDDKNAEYQDTELARLQPDTDSEVYARAVRRLEQVQKQQRSDPAGFLRSQNEEVQAAYERAAHVPDSLTGQWLNMAHATSLKFQGYAPAGASKDDAARYLNLPTHARHLLSMQDATDKARQINQGTAREGLQVINQVLGGYDQEHFHVAFNDLVTLPKDGVAPAMQLAFLIQGRSFAEKYMMAISDPEKLKSLTTEKSGDIGDEIDADPDWQSFRQALLAGGRRTDEVAAWRSGLISYAHILSGEGKKLSDASDTAVKHLLSTSFGFPKVHGQPIIIERTKRDGTTWTDDEVNDLGRRLQLALADVPVQHVDQTPFMSLPLVGTDDVRRLQDLRNRITSTGFFQSSPDGRSVTLYVQDQEGVAFEVRDKNGAPFEIDLEDLPQFTFSQYSAISFRDITVKEQPQATYPLTTKESAIPGSWGGHKITKTNWPSGALFKRKPPARITELQAP